MVDEKFKTWNFIFVFLLSIILLITPIISRFVFFGGLPRGRFNYHDIRLARLVKDNFMNGKFGLTFEDELTSRVYVVKPYYLILAFLLNFFTDSQILNFMPLLLGVITFLLFYMILTMFKVEKDVRIVSLGFLALSPAFISNFTVLNEGAVLTTISLLGFILLFQKRNYASVIGSLLLVFCSLNNLWLSIIVFFTLLIFLINNRKKNCVFWRITLLLTFLIISILNLYIRIKFSTVTINQNIIDLFSEISFSSGFSVLTLILAMIGFIIVRKKKPIIKGLFFVMLISILVFNSEVILYANFLVCLLSAYALVWMLRRDWALKELKFWSLTIIICGLLFVALSVDFRVASSGPTLHDFDVLYSLAELKGGKTLSHYKNGFWIEYFSNKSTLLDDFSDEKSFKSAKIIFYSLNLTKTLNEIEKNKIKYILITPDMKLGVVWSKSDEGLLFLLKNSKRFNLLYNKNKYEIWEVLYGYN